MTLRCTYRSETEGAPDEVEEYEIPDTVTGLADYAFFDDERLTSIVLPDGIKHIGSYAFASCPNLSSVTLPNHLTCIKKMAFAHCDALTSLKLPNTVTRIDNDAFLCYNGELTLELNEKIKSTLFVFNPKKTHLSVSKESKRFCIADGVLFNKRKTLLLRLLEEKRGIYYIPKSVKKIDHLAFYQSKLSEIILPEGVTWIGVAAFARNEHLTRLELPNTLKHISSFAFGFCDQLPTLRIPTSVTSQDPDAFNDYHGTLLYNNGVSSCG